MLITNIERIRVPFIMFSWMIRPCLISSISQACNNLYDIMIWGYNSLGNDIRASRLYQMKKQCCRFRKIKQSEKKILDRNFQI